MVQSSAELEGDGGVERARDRERVMILERVGEAGRGGGGEGEWSGDRDGDARSMSMQSCGVKMEGIVSGLMKNRNQGVDSTPP
jgi:hypothetical protein